MHDNDNALEREKCKTKAGMKETFGRTKFLNSEVNKNLK